MITAGRGGTYIDVQVSPGAHRSGIVGRQGDALKVSVREPPNESRANNAVAELLASSLGVPRSRVFLVAGRSSRRKRFFVSDFDIDVAKRALEPPS